MPHAFRPVVIATRDRLTGVFGHRLHSAHLYGSIPRGTARVSRSDLARLLPRRRRRIAGAGDTEEARRHLVRFMSRPLVRTGCTVVMPRWNGWTRDLPERAEAFAGYCPERGGQMRAAAALGREPAGEAAVPAPYLGDLGPWLAGEYARVHGVKAQRP
ncbi:hypothetical protein ACFU3E_12745 [Streptomyces sp. NPDC057424]|uniref:hypothetical protein n=1 Tax=Streptomyces sp. NPDC057424 TaxID=3346127 RepID=UPI0036AA94FA